MDNTQRFCPGEGRCKFLHKYKISSGGGNKFPGQPSGLSIFAKIFLGENPGGAHVKILIGMLVLFFGFEIWPNLIFLGWQIFQLFFWVLQNFRYFLRSDKFPALFWVFQFLYHTLESFE